MTSAKLLKNFLFVIFCHCIIGITFGATLESSEIEEQEYKQDMARIKALEKSFTSGPTNDLENYEKFVDQIQKKWVQKNREHYARLLLEICGPLSSGDFKGNRPRTLARKYALSALETPEAIPLTLELELIGHVMMLMYTPDAPKGEDFAQSRKKDVEVRLHAWKRLIDAIDPNWDPNDKPLRNVSPPYGTTISAGASPEHIKDPKLRADYEAAIEKNRRKAERYLEQSRLRDWLKRYPKRAEEYIILAYSDQPFNLQELKQYLDKYIADEKTRNRILDTVKKNIEGQAAKPPKEPPKAPPTNSIQR